MAENKGINALPMKAKIALLIMCPLLIITLCSGVIILYAGSLVEEDAYTPPAEQVEYLSIAPESNEDRIKAANDLMSAAQQSGETQISVSHTVDLSAFTSDLSEAQQNLLVFSAGSVESGIAALAESPSIDYGETADLFAPFATDAVELTQDTENHKFRYTAATENTFSEADDALFEKAEELFAVALTVNDKQVTLSDSTTELVVDPVSDRLQNVIYTRTYHMEYAVTFTGDLAELGTKTLTFDCTLVSNYTVRWAGISIGKDLITLNKSGYEALSVTVNRSSAEDTQYTLTFTSSDESVVTVDESGIAEAVALSDTPVTVTATLEYLGKTYTDSCEVLVIVEPESVKMHSKAQTLQIGETVTLSASVEPEKASIKTIIWYSPDESVATVDENGVVTAVGEGKVQIIAVSKIGEYMAGCDITVEGGAD